jgi:hypothetical protein
MRRYFLFLPLAALALWMGAAQSAGEWRLGILDGHRLLSIGIQGGAPSKAIDIHQQWPRNVFFRSEKQGAEFPSISILAAWPEGGTFLANLWGLANREDGPLVLGTSRTGDLLRTIPVSGDGTVAAFVPPDGRRIAASWNDSNGDGHAAVFDSATGKKEAELPPGRLPASRFLFTATPPRLLYIPDQANGSGGIELLPVDSWRDGGRLTLPGANAAVLDLQQDTLLIESRDALITVSAWEWTRPGAAPVVIHSREYGGSGSIRYLLASHGHRVVEWTAGSPAPVLLYDSTTGKAAGRVDAKGPVRACAADPSDKMLALAIERSIVFIDSSDGRVISRAQSILSAEGDISLFWFR